MFRMWILRCGAIEVLTVSSLLPPPFLGLLVCGWRRDCFLLWTPVTTPRSTLWILLPEP